ncbi:MAG: VUT family protein [Candidatus Melainabacteria bacterium]|nr:MAG: VUT family protein [Candidatus Melainabacteria bacterium]
MPNLLVKDERSIQANRRNDADGCLPARESISSLYTFIVAAYICVIVLSISASSKFIAMGPFTICGRTTIWPLTFVLSNIFTDVYGYRRSRRIIWAGLAAQIFTALVYWGLGVLPGADFWHNQGAYDQILGQGPRIVLATVFAYLVGEYITAVGVSKMKFAQRGKSGGAQYLRFLSCTTVGEFWDTLLFYVIGFIGVVPLSELGKTMICIYLVKIAYEAVMLPVSAMLAEYVKRAERIDVTDGPETNYAMFS